MNKKNMTVALTIGLLCVKGVFAGVPTDEKGELDLSTIVYIEEEEVIDLGFDTADYLPEDFDPYKVYFDLNSVTVIAAEIEIDFDSKENLPANFDAYAYPTDCESFNYIDANDTLVLDFDSTNHLPEGFDPYIK
ncbi:hypothetical protein FGM00_01575 [Aggregatimonas sangjinii]|uniref:Uncharacterized protein n=1 Tax=Aggregatimonas sangjinii TaxID=2583587 RepID=A0A5B7SPF6_9FLAO|nr:hypothetical protein [Aggregatimonas sangjinii]QCW98872.1 hypothetical protein FGM00_01575 [Aggregatimonas sangjinii]